MTLLTKAPSLIASLISLTVLTTAVVGCDDDAQDPMGEPDDSETPDETSEDPEPEGHTDPAADESTGWQYTGGWTLTADYEVRCQSSETKNQESRSVTEEVQISGSGDLFADIGEFRITGTGDATTLNLSGSFPLMGIDQLAISGTDNMITFNGTEASDDHVTGDLSGTFDEAGGAHCEIVDGSFEMTR